MTFELFEHTADIGVRGIGETVEESFEECAKAMTSIMVDLETIELTKTIAVEISSNDLNSLLIDWLNEILAQMDVESMVFSGFKVKIKDNSLTAELKGEDLNQSKHNTKTEVKAATFHESFVKQEDNKWVAQCIVDV